MRIADIYEKSSLSNLLKIAAIREKSLLSTEDRLISNYYLLNIPDSTAKSLWSSEELMISWRSH